MFGDRAFSLTYALRSLGLAILAFSIYRCFGSRSEPRKRVIKHSLWIAISHCWIHLLPVGVTISLLWLNLRGCYIGRHMQVRGYLVDDNVAFALIQVAAKVQVICYVTDVVPFLY